MTPAHGLKATLVKLSESNLPQPTATLTLQPDQTQNLQPGERIVSDHYKHSGLLIYASQRITSDPNDHGRQCEPEGYLEDVVRRIHGNAR